jgi:diadenylate cyclase
MEKKEVYESILDIAKEISREKKSGGLFLIAPGGKIKGTYKSLYAQILSGNAMIDEKGISEVIKSLASLDGALIITDTGRLFSYGAMVKKLRPIRGFGTKHAAAAGFTSEVKNSIAILIEEKKDWIKVFKKGRIVLEMDSGKGTASAKSKIAKFLAEDDTALLSAAGLSAAVLGLAPILVLGGAYLVIKTATGIIKKNIK